MKSTKVRHRGCKWQLHHLSNKTLKSAEQAGGETVVKQENRYILELKEIMYLWIENSLWL